jgi:DNA repair photolyase
MPLTPKAKLQLLEINGLPLATGCKKKCNLRCTNVINYSLINYQLHVATSKPFVSPSFTYETLEETLDIKPKGAELFIGIPKETSFSENRVALTPEAVGVMVANGHRVVMETKAGHGAVIQITTTVKQVQRSLTIKKKFMNVISW